jgi:MFS family permease
MKNNAVINNAIKTLLAFIFIFNVSAGLYLPIIAIYITENIVGGTLIVVGISTAVYSISKSVIQVLIARGLDKKSKETSDFMFLMTGIILAVFYSLGYLLIQNHVQLYLLQIIIGIADACIMAAYYAIFSHHIDKNSQGFEWSLFSTVGLTLSTALGGIFSGYIALKYGFSFLFILSAVLNLVAAILLLSLFPYVKNFRKDIHYKNTKL